MPTPCFPNHTRVHAVGNLDLDGPIYFDLKKRNSTADGKPVWQVTNVYYVSGRRGKWGRRAGGGGGAGLERGEGGAGACKAWQGGEGTSGEKWGLVVRAVAHRPPRLTLLRLQGQFLVYEAPTPTSKRATII